MATLMSGPERADLKDMTEDQLWDTINDHRHRISLGVKPCMLIPYLRQVRVLSEMDEDEILSNVKFNNRAMRTSHMLDLLCQQGRNGALALLESLMIHYPMLYTQVTGRKPTIELSEFSDLIKGSELTEYLVRAMTSMQQELQEARSVAATLTARCSVLEKDLSQAQQQANQQQRMQTEQRRLRTHMANLHQDVLRLKDEKCDLYVRYTATIQENSVVNIRCRELQLQMYQLQFELRKAQKETDFQRQRSLKNSSSTETQQLREEIHTLQRRLLEAEKFTPAKEDILTKDLEEARDGRMELVEQLHCHREENERLARERDQLVEEKECLALQVQNLSLDCEMYQQKSTTIQSQLKQLQEERDLAYLARDEAQAQIARSLAEKDTMRGQLVELQEKLFTLRAQWNKEDRQLSWESSKESVGEDTIPSPPPLLRAEAICPEQHSGMLQDCELSWESSRESITEDPILSACNRPPLRRTEAICHEQLKSMDSLEGFNSLTSEHAEPPGMESMRRRQQEELCVNQSLDSFPSLSDPDSDYVIISAAAAGCPAEDGSISRQPSPTPSCKPCGSSAAPPFLIRSRPKALRMTGRVVTISFQGEELLSQLQVIGGNKTGVFIHEVKEGSAAQNVGITPGAQILEVQYDKGLHSLRMVLEDITLEEAMWALGQVQGFCHLSMRPNRDAYEQLLQQLHSGEASSGDSFYVRVNMSLSAGGPGALVAKCNDILHVTDTWHGAEGRWKACIVHPCKLHDLRSGTLPNYYRAQRLLIQAIEDISFEHKPHRRTERRQDQEKQKAVRIVSTGRQGRNPLWVCVEENHDNERKDAGCSTVPRSCITLMPYTLVTPHHPPASRPVLLLPSVHGLIMNKKLGDIQGFHLCEPELLSSSECVGQKAEILEDCGQSVSHCYTVQSVERVIKQSLHCVLPLGLDCIRRLHRAEIFPIVIFITNTQRTVRKLRHKLHRLGLSEEQLLECSRSEEPLLDKLPCLYRSVSPDCWSDSASLLAVLRSIVTEEQKKIVWVEPDLW